MQDIINALPEAAAQVSEMVSTLFTSGVALVIIPFLFIEILVVVFKLFRGRDDA